jgi:hypothetical protein
MRAQAAGGATTAVALTAAGLAVGLSAPAPAHRIAAAPGCPILPKSNPWNRRVDRLPLSPHSAAYVRSIGLGASAHADFGSGRWEGRPIGIPVTVVSKATKRVRVRFDYAGESDRGPYPIPKRVRIEGGGDRHAILVDRSACRDYELYALRRGSGGRWRAGSGAIWNLRKNGRRPRGWTSADAAGLPILPGLARPGDLKHGSIDHALRFTAPRTRKAFVFPASHYASSSTDPALPPMGARIRLKRSVSLRGFGRQARIVAIALERYGAILADNGSPWYFSGVPSPAWDDDDLHGLGRLRGRDFEVVAPRSSGQG